MAPGCGGPAVVHSPDGPWRWCKEHAGPNDVLILGPFADLSDLPIRAGQ